MSPVKEKAIDLIKSLPDDCTLEDIQYHLYVCQKVQRGLEDVEGGHVVSHEEVQRRMSKWLRK